jgi:GTP-binding protein
MLIDDVTITVSSGHGGAGAVAFNKNMMSLGPTGGSGGLGGSVYMEGVSDILALRNFRNQKVFTADDGENGKRQYNDGRDAEDLILKVPVGTVIHNKTTGEPPQEVVRIGERKLIAKGGKGGKGNFHFRSSRNTSPTQFQSGLPGQTFEIRLELKLIADVGLIGLPNAGKSSLLNAITSSRAKVANYAFTTLEPNLGAYFGLIIADVPGLIEGASTGKGLGIKFLRHIDRTKVLFHLISCESDDLLRDYRVIQGELKQYNPELARKKEYVFLSKSDVVDKKELKEKREKRN